jgi:hypothetical protein
MATCAMVAAALAGCVVGEDQGVDNDNDTDYNGPGGGDGDRGGGGGGSGSGSGGGTPGTSTVASVLDKMDRADCDSAFACKATFVAGNGPTHEQIFGANAAACYTKLATEYYNATDVQTKMAAGKIAFIAASGDTCISGITAAPAPNCNTLWQTGPGFPNACYDAISGKVATGATCDIDWECAPNAYCDGQTAVCTLIP